MTAAELVSALTARGVTLAPRPGGRLSVSPLEMVRPDELSALKAHKPEVLHLLGGPPPAPHFACPACGSAEYWYNPEDPEPAVRCWRCEPHPSFHQVAAGVYAGPVVTLIAQTIARGPGRACEDAPGSTEETAGGVCPTPLGER